ncbi:aryl-phospho-beta-D-glucosidase BglC, GH1 family [Terrimicrobium sacchariphilum]|uniref:Aryl-phospho-beta-D-glucosidase BglC, GH1 family n=1 Tax=Terrimicrobium sacchariphilum TaxID=690879 RepID=A0A146GGD7_TERSA|nr:cellulase family glycosylhydrolase [Terrimicrobium sacchariphilum]GAT35486.1 aryl-phospho-beta-D-glucosidase BglC, GH1 family [Terrimicrobium sacchariphilum]
MPPIALFIALLLLATPLAQGETDSSRSQPVVSVDFENGVLSPDWKSEGSGNATLVPEGFGAKSLLVTLPDQGSRFVHIPLSAESVRGRRIALSAHVRGENVTRPREPWNGVKVMLKTVAPGGTDYQGLMDLYGTFNWKSCGLITTIPADVTEATLMLGIQDASGKAWFDDVSLLVLGKLRSRPASPPALLPPEKLDRRTDLPRLRGVMYGPQGREEDIRKLAEWGANLIRWQFYWYDGTFPEKRLDLALYDQWLEATMAEVDRMLPLCEQLGIRVLIDLHTPPGATESRQSAIFQKAEYQKKFLEVWEKLARHYKDKPAIWGYDLLNEPAEGSVAPGLLDWHSLADLTAHRVREIDPHRAIIVEPGPYGGWGNLPFFEPIAVPGIVYSIHMYDPLAFTHQGVLDGYPVGVEYPGMIRGVLWNKEKLREILAPVREFQKDYNVPIFVGEFSAIRWAPGDSAACYLRDCIEIFEEYGWDWAYHAFREWHGWNVEVGSVKDDTSPAPVPTTREKELRAGLSKNQSARAVNP